VVTGGTGSDNLILSLDSRKIGGEDDVIRLAMVVTRSTQIS
jgi:hypothetical protein